MRSFVELEDVDFAYGAVRVLERINLTVEPGDFLGIIGPNGSGKTTLLRVLATALHPHRGSAQVLGHDVQGDREAVRRRVALLSHHSYHYEALSARENLEVSARFLARDGVRAALLPTLEQVGLLARADDPVASFSAGMRKRLSLARVLLQDPEVVLLDEPYGELDPPGFDLVDGLLESLRAKGATVLMATHLLERGRALCDEALTLEGGQVVYAGPADGMPVPRDGHA